MKDPAAERDLVVHLARFAGALRREGITLGMHEEMDALSALTRLDLLERDEVRWGLRSALRIRRRDWVLFDVLFDRWWSQAPRSDNPSVDRVVDPPEAGRTPSQAVRAMQPIPEPRPADQADTDGTMPGYSPDERLRHKPFDACTDQDLAAMERLLRRLPPPSVAARRSRRLVPVSGRGRVDIRRSLRHAVGTQGDILWLARRAHPRDEPRYVVLVDTSGSMDPHSRFLLAFILSLKRVLKRVEVFAFNTSLTRLTPWLRLGSSRPCLERLAAEVPDWSGGTRIGECLTEFVARYLESAVDARTEVVILSDGLDCGDPEVLVRAMRALRRRASRVTWLNPLLGDERYRPEARGMAAALPFLDRFAPAHDLASLERAFARAAS